MTQVAVLVDELARPLRSAWRTTVAASTGAAVVGVLGAAAWSARLGLLEADWWAAAAWAAAAGAGVVWWVRARRAHRTLAPAAFAGQLEALGAARRGALTAHFDAPLPGTSPALQAAADAGARAELAARAVEALAPVTRQAQTARRRALVAGLAAVGVLAAARPMQGEPARLWRPLSALGASRTALVVTASAATVERGGRVTLTISAPGQRRVVLQRRAPGEPWRSDTLAVDSLGRAARTLGPLTADLFAYAAAGDLASDTIAVTVRLPVFVASLGVTARYPAYLGLEDEPVPVGGDTLLLPVGTRLETRGTATGPLASAAWTLAGARLPLTVEARRFAGVVVPSVSGVWRLILTTPEAGGLGGDSITLPIRLVPDAAPTVEVPVPGADTTAAPGADVPLVADIRDDHGVRGVVLEARRISARGERGPLVRRPLPLPPGTADRAIVPGVLRTADLGAVAGDTVRFRIVATDNSPGAQAGASKEFVLRLATLSELRAEQRRATDGVRAALDSLASLGRQLERRTGDQAQEAPRGAPRPDGSADETLSYEQARKAEAIVEQQRELAARAEQAEEAIRQLQEGATQAGLQDAELQAKLAEVRQQLEKALSPELKQKLAQLQQSLKELDGRKTQEAMQELARAQQELRETLERARELFQRAALEGQLQNLAQEAKDLAQEQRTVAEQAATADSARTAAAQETLAAQADSLASALEATAGEMPSERGEQAIRDAAQQAKQAAQQMRKAGQEAKAGRKDQAKQQGEQAAEQLEPAAEKVEDEKQRQQQEWRREVQRLLDRALAETSRLVERQLQVAGQMRRAPGATARAAQGAVEEGTGRLVDQLRTLAGKNALVPPGIAVALATAQNSMAKAREAISTANANPREAEAQAGEAVDALNVAAYQMIRARSSVENSQSGSGVAEAMQQMAQMAQQQGSLGQQGQGLLPQMGGQGMGEQLRQLGAQQRALAEQLQKLRGQANMPGAGAMAEEAKEIARELEARRLDRELVERQERLFKRMLDAGRTLQGSEQDEQKEREATAAKPGEVRLPPELKARLDDGRLRAPSWDELQRLSPDERRLVADYFRRLAEQRAPR